MIASAVFSRYAKSLADVVVEQNATAEVGRDLELYRQIFLAVPELLDTFYNPAIPGDAKARILSELVRRYPVSRTTGNFLKILLDHNRLRYFHEIFDLYAKTLDERRGIVTASVTSAAPLSDKEQSVLREALARATGKGINLDIRTDGGLLGGLVVQIGSTIYDGSVRSQLAEMRQRLME